MRVLVLALALVTSCAHGPAVFSASPSSEAEARAAVVEAIALWPDIEPYAQRMDIFFETQERIEAGAICGRALAEHPTSCLAWEGRPDLPVIGRRGRIYLIDKDVREHVLHELQHLHLGLRPGGDTCVWHLASCGWVKIPSSGG